MNKHELQVQINLLRDRLERIRKDIKSPLDADSSMQAIQLQTREVLMELERVESLKLAQLEQELAKT